MKKAKWLWMAMIMAVIIFSLSANAEAKKSNKYFDMYMVEKEGSYSPVELFDYSETPWVYIHMPKADDYRLKVSWWYGLDPTLVIYGDTQDVWVSLEGGWDGRKWKEWDDIKEPGVWSVSANYKYYDCHRNCNGHDLIRFNVNQPVAPEPISSMLFIVGGATIGAIRLRKQKK